MQREARRLTVQALSDQDFERLVHDLLVQERAQDGVKMQKLRAPDHGADSLVRRRAGAVEEVIQAKRFTVRPHWGQCEESLDSAAAAWNPPRMTFVFALDFTGGQQQEFDRRLVSRYPGIEVDAVTLTDLDHLLDAHPQVGPRYLGLGASGVQAAIERATRLGGQRLDSGLDLLARSEELGRFGDEMDSRFAYTQSSSSLECPRPQFDRLPYLSIEKTGERERVNVTVWAREGSGIELPEIVFNDDEAGREVLAQAREGLARGEAVTIRGGVRLMFSTAPKLVEDLVAEGWSAQAGTLRPSRPVELQVDVVGAAGPIQRHFALYAVPPRSGNHPCLASSGESLWFELGIEPLTEPQVALNFRCSVRPGGEFAQNAAAAAFALALVDAERITFRCSALFPDDGVSSDQGMGSEAQRPALTFLRDFHTDLAHIEKALDVSLELPNMLTRADVDVVGTVAETLRTGEGVATVGKAENVVQADHLSELQETVEGLVKRKRVTYTVLGRELDLGLAEYAIPPMRIIGIHAHGGTASAPARVEYAPADDDQARFRLIEGPDD